MKVYQCLILLLTVTFLFSCSNDNQVCTVDSLDSNLCILSGDGDSDVTLMDIDTLAFPNSSLFANQCTSEDATAEKMFLRSWSNELYLWYDEIIAQDPSNFSVTDYFDTLKTDELTASGAPKDQFHFWLPTDQYNDSNAGASFGYGIRWAINQSNGSRSIKVAYTEPTRAAALGAINRGDALVQIDTTRVDTTSNAGIQFLNDALFNAQPNQRYRFYFKRPDQTEYSTILTSGAFSFSPVNTALTLTHSSSRQLGYLAFHSFIASAERPLINVFSQFEQAGVDELVLDLRYNGGGLLFLASQLAYMIAGDSASRNKIFELSRFNIKHPLVNPVTLESIMPLPFYSRGIGFNNDVPVDFNLPSLNLDRVYVLSSDETCSASEAVINGLRGIDIEVILIGDTSCGKPYGFYPRDNCGKTYFSIQFEGVNNKGFGEYSDGFTPQNSLDFTAVGIPGCSVEDTINANLGDPDEVLFNQAIQLIEGGTCTARPVSQIPMKSLPLLRGLSSGQVNEVNAPSIELKRPAQIPGRIITRP